MRHGMANKKLNRTSEHRKALLKNMLDKRLTLAMMLYLKILPLLDMCLSLSLCHALLVVLVSFTTYPVAWVSAVCVLWVSISSYAHRHRASIALLANTRIVRARRAVQHVLAAGTRIPRVLCSVIRVILVSTLSRQPTTAQCVLLVASMATWTQSQPAPRLRCRSPSTCSRYR